MRYSLRIIVVLLAIVLAVTAIRNGRADDTSLGVIVWTCPDPALYDIVRLAIRKYDSVDDICDAIREMLKGYNNQLWSVSTLVYTRSTADLLPSKHTTSKNVCFVTVNSEKIIVFITAVAPSL
ncbi:hypothetical protein Q1695_014970 [Nippostrongylus brasiliensis]|nr:hypothetical protein Q1695_014970 [Nippostrongylus brasiliensis]